MEGEHEVRECSVKKINSEENASAKSLRFILIEVIKRMAKPPKGLTRVTRIKL